MTYLAHQGAVLEGLGALRTAGGLEPVRRLLAELNYQVATQSLPDRDWGKAAREALGGAPVLLAAHNDFHVIHVPLRAAGRLRLGDERAVVGKLLRDHPYALFLFSDSSQRQWHFLNVKYAAQADRRRLYRRITVGPDERLRTASERIAMLDVSDEAMSPLALQTRHDDAFDVEAVTRQFYGEYKQFFSIMQDDLRRQTKDRQWAHDYALQFLNRTMFLYFVQRKGWLGGDRDFLGTFWSAYQDSKGKEETFFERWLKVLFFQAFNNGFHGGHRQFPDEIRNALATAPYLNGGLFAENELDNEHSFAVSDALFRQVFTLLERYNFTIAEDSPLDQEVAVDPEMIGKVYETLVNVEETSADQRSAAGIFYTPRTEIDLMCRLALVDNLSNVLGQGRKSLLYDTIFAVEPEDKLDADAALDRAELWKPFGARLREVTVVDPACGSGSFLVGMLHILDDLQERAQRHLGGTREPSYDRRKRIIGQNLYGVDVMEWACHVAELRLWLALIIDAEFSSEDLHVRKEPLLPHFSFKIRRGDSLVEEIGGVDLSHARISHQIGPDLKTRITRLKTGKLKFYNNEPDGDFRSKTQIEQEELRVFRDILDARRRTVGDTINSLRRKIEGPARQIRLDGTTEPGSHQMGLDAAQSRQQIAALESELERVEQARVALKSLKDVPFVWDIAFVEIFEGDRDGFDIVVGNPPYVRTQSIADPRLSPDMVTTENKKTYKNKLQRATYAAFPSYFRYNQRAETAALKIDAKSDLYVYFYFRAVSLLNSQGSLCFITSNSWLDVDYGAELQEFLLRFCRIELVLDNRKRSFAEADINTVIALIGLKREVGVSAERAVRFVMFKAPYEEILSAVIFEEIADTSVRKVTPEYRLVSMTEKELLDAGLEASLIQEKSEGHSEAALIKASRYQGNKWGGLYLRAPDVVSAILSQRRELLQPLGRYITVSTYLILPRKADQVLIVASEEVPSGLKRFFRPFVRSPRYFDKPWLSSTRHQILVCSTDDVLRNRQLADFVSAAKTSLKRDFGAVPDKRDWYVIAQDPGPILCQRRFGERHLVFFNPEGFLSYDLYRLFPKDGHSGTALVLAGLMMSTLFWLFKELFGRSNLGEGALKTEGTDLSRMYLVDPARVSRDLVPEIRRILRRPVLPLEEELQQDDRRQLDRAIFDILHLSKAERNSIYDAVFHTVRQRLTKAVSLSQRERRNREDAAEQTRGIWSGLAIEEEDEA